MKSEDFKIHVIFFSHCYEEADYEIKAFDTGKEASDWVIKTIKENENSLATIDIDNFDVIVGQKRKLSIKETEVVTEYEIQGVRE